MPPAAKGRDPLESLLRERVRLPTLFRSDSRGGDRACSLPVPAASRRD